MLRFCRNIGSDAFFGKTHSDSVLKQSRRMSTEFETNSKWKAMYRFVSKVSTMLPKRKAGIDF